MWELLGLPPQASAHAADVDQLIVLLHWMMAILFVGWGAFFLYTLVRFRQSANPKADYTGVKSHSSSYLDVVLALVEAVLLIGFAIPAWATRVDALPAAPSRSRSRVMPSGRRRSSRRSFHWSIEPSRCSARPRRPASCWNSSTSWNTPSGGGTTARDSPSQ